MNESECIPVAVRPPAAALHPLRLLPSLWRVLGTLAGEGLILTLGLHWHYGCGHWHCGCAFALVGRRLAAEASQPGQGSSCDVRLAEACMPQGVAWMRPLNLQMPEEGARFAQRHWGECRVAAPAHMLALLQLRESSWVVAVEQCCRHLPRALLPARGCSSQCRSLVVYHGLSNCQVLELHTRGAVVSPWQLAPARSLFNGTSLHRAD